MAADHTQLALRVMTATRVRSRSVRLVLPRLIVRIGVQPRGAREALAGERGRQVGPESPCEGGQSIRLFRGPVPPGEYRQFESIAPACQIRLRGVRGSTRKGEQVLNI